MVTNMYEAALTHSNAADDEQAVPESYARRACAGFAQLGARGISVLFASGDTGVGPEKKECFSDTNPKERKFLPNFPSSCRKYLSYIPALRQTTQE